ncbi:hypothetical protein [Leifsonia virtsii]|uniref:Tyr recombinase domain-containing protein n=1 Tax=Leifsonia virtsii TaxID=3035915 RepID=A0ABT8IZ24_9MICO|nr:hypothetical protein [Leifsonia virtsii]MDN4598030.1 hypothetical protein [Leifsonia virtsii]
MTYGSETAYEPRKLKPALSALAAWSSRQGLPLQPEVVLTRGNIAAFVDSGVPHLSPGTRGNYRSQLLRIAEVALPETLAPQRLPALSPSSPAAPYSREEQDHLKEWARRQHRSRRTDATTLLALGLGAGLSATEIGRIRAQDVILDNSGAVILRITSGRSRDVPVLRRWERGLRTHAESLCANDYLFLPGRSAAGKNLISNWVAREPGPIHVQTQRLRATWLVTHMSASTPMVELVRAAGVDSLEALTRYLPFVAARQEADALKLLRSA